MAQRRQRHRSVPSLKWWLFPVCGIWLVWAFLGCRSGYLLNTHSSSGHRVWNWGGDTMRRAWNPSRIRPPLALAWTHKAMAAPGLSLLGVESTLICATKGGYISMLDVESGKKIKILKIEKKVEVTCASDGDLLFVAMRWSQPSMQAYDLVSGRSVWKKHLGPIEGEILVCEDRLYFGTDTGMAYALDSRSGKVIWHRQMDGAARGSLAASQGVIYGVTEEGSIWALDADDGSTLWQHTYGAQFMTGPVLGDERLFIGSREGVFYAIQPENGDIIWRHLSEGCIYEAAATDGSDVFFGTTQGIMECLDGNDGASKWAFRTRSVIGTSPLITEEMILFGTLNKMIYGLNRNSGDEMWSVEVNGRVRTTPILWQGRILAASEEHHVYGFVEMH